MATIHKVKSHLVLIKNYSECFWSNTKFWGELEKLGANSTKVGANSKLKFYSGGELGEGELAMGRNRYHSLVETVDLGSVKITLDVCRRRRLKHAKTFCEDSSLFPIFCTLTVSV